MPIRQMREKQEASTYNCGDEGAVETGVSVRANPTPSLDAWEPLGASECSSFPSARPTMVFGGGMRPGSFPAADRAAGFEVTPLGRWCRESAEDMMAERAMPECCAIQRGRTGLSQGLGE